MSAEETIYLTLPELLTGVGHDLRFQHEIKGKRVKKELSNLQEYQHQQITFQKYALTSSGISLYVRPPPSRFKCTTRTVWSTSS